jgi:hypothetical protein
VRILATDGQLIASRVLGPVVVSALGFLAPSELLAATSGGLLVWNAEADTMRVLAQGFHSRLAISPHHILAVRQGELWLHDRAAGTVGVLPDMEAQRATAICISPDERSVAVGLTGGDVILRHLDEAQPHRLIGPTGNVTSLRIDPRGFWIAVATESGQLWWLPVPRGRPLGALTRGEFLELLRAQTNVRVEIDPMAPEGYRQTRTDFPGWETVPTWQEWYTEEYMQDPPWTPMLDPKWSRPSGSEGSSAGS